MSVVIFFFFNDTATTEIYTSCHTLSLHDALPIYPACSPEHAAMGHCKPGDEAPATDAGMVGTDLPAGDAPAPPPPADWYADPIYPTGEMEHSRHVRVAACKGVG